MGINEFGLRVPKIQGKVCLNNAHMADMARMADRSLRVVCGNWAVYSVSLESLIT